MNSSLRLTCHSDINFSGVWLIFAFSRSCLIVHLLSDALVEIQGWRWFGAQGLLRRRFPLNASMQVSVTGSGLLLPAETCYFNSFGVKQY